MVKLTHFSLFICIFGVVAVIAFCESVTVSKPKSRTKVIVKKKRIIPTTEAPTTTSSTTIEPEDQFPTLATINTPADSSEDSSNSNESKAIRTSKQFLHSSEAEDVVSNPSSGQIWTLHDSILLTSRRPVKVHRTLNNCDECIPEDCETPPATNCPTGLIMDSCSCCFICASVEGNRCYNSSLDLPYNPVLGICGPGLTCQLRNDLRPYEQKEALCECGTKITICGSDNRTYQSECKLHEAAYINPNLTVKNWHPCYSSPTIPAQVDNVTVGTGDDVSLSCEVRAFPPPVIHWEFLSEDSNSRVILPGDDSSVVVTIRGGPEKTMTTSWIQIISVTPERQGIYFCFAKNDEGMTQSSAFVSVYKNNNSYFN